MNQTTIQIKLLLATRLRLIGMKEEERQKNNNINNKKNEEKKEKKEKMGRKIIINN